MTGAHRNRAGRARAALLGALALLLTLHLLAGSAAAGAPARAGFTLELGAGIGHARAIQGYDPGRQVDGPGVGPLSLGAGVYVAQDWALLLRTAGLLFRHDRGDGSRWYWNQQIGLAVQHWVRPELGFGGGLGVVVIATAPVEVRSNRGLGGSMRGTWAPWRWQESALALSWELQAGVFLNYEVTFNSLLLVEWQRF